MPTKFTGNVVDDFVLDLDGVAHLANPAVLQSAVIALEQKLIVAQQAITTAQGQITTLQQQAAAHTGTPTVATAAGAGATPPAPVLDATAQDARGGLTCGTGTTPTATGSALVTLTFQTAYATAPFVVLTPRNADTAALGPAYVTNVTTTGFTISVPGTPTPLAESQANTVYSWAYRVSL